MLNKKALQSPRPTATRPQGVSDAGVERRTPPSIVVVPASQILFSLPSIIWDVKNSYDVVITFF